MEAGPAQVGTDVGADGPEQLGALQTGGQLGDGRLDVGVDRLQAVATA
ncbi:hypothetical protein [Nocardioides lianchengensis]|nr:hypothetical protein [Nocardioides lianchengensis]